MVDQEVKKNLLKGKFDFITPFYNQPHDNKSLVEGLDSLLSSYDLSVKSIPFSSDTHPSKFFTGIQEKLRKIKVLRTYAGVQLFRLTHSYKEGSEIKEEEGDFFVYENPGYDNVYVALTLESTKKGRNRRPGHDDLYYPQKAQEFTGNFSKGKPLLKVAYYPRLPSISFQ